MELSINAIITLVIAMTVLALGLGMIRGVLSFGGDSLASALEGYTIEFDATPSDSFVLSHPLTLKQGGPTIVLTSFYNTEYSQCDDIYLNAGAWISLDCTSLEIENIQTVPLDIPLGHAATLAASITLKSGTAPGTYPCIARVYCGTRSERASENGLVTQDPASDSLVNEPVFIEVR
ncbi:MAG: hypothetical protein KC535_03555 [Nanoarchaeota archaeon]|nr:hypothetical protein [Nanoarchaeota archaeon]